MGAVLVRQKAQTLMCTFTLWHSSKILSLEATTNCFYATPTLTTANHMVRFHNFINIKHGIAYFTLIILLNALASNKRYECNKMMERAAAEVPWFGIEQEYTILDVDQHPLQWPKNGFPAPQGIIIVSFISMHCTSVWFRSLLLRSWCWPIIRSRYCSRALPGLCACWYQGCRYQRWSHAISGENKSFTVLSIHDTAQGQRLMEPIYVVGVPSWTTYWYRCGWSSLDGAFHPSSCCGRFWCCHNFWSKTRGWRLERSWCPYQFLHSSHAWKYTRHGVSCLIFTIWFSSRVMCTIQISLIFQSNYCCYWKVGLEAWRAHSGLRYASRKRQYAKAHWAPWNQQY